MGSDDMGRWPSCTTILAERSSIPGGVGGEADDAGDVDVERYDSGVSGISGDIGSEYPSGEDV